MKKIIFLTILISPYFIKAQTKDEFKYKATSIELVLMDGDKVLSRKPYGRDINITYDKFFKSYYITFYNEESEFGYIKLFYIKELGDASGTVRMRTEQNDIVNVVDMLKSKGGMVIMLEQKVNNATGCYMIYNAVSD